jgi:hypothetical protein
MDTTVEPSIRGRDGYDAVLFPSSDEFRPLPGASSYRPRA